MADEIYNIEVERNALRSLRLRHAHELIGIGLLLADGKRPEREAKQLWESMEAARKRYDLACAAVSAIELHHMDSYLFEQTKDFISTADEERRVQARERIDDGNTMSQFERGLLAEIRGIRDRVDPPSPKYSDRDNALKELQHLVSGGK